MGFFTYAHQVVFSELKITDLNAATASSMPTAYCGGAASCLPHGVCGPAPPPAPPSPPSQPPQPPRSPPSPPSVQTVPSTVPSTADAQEVKTGGDDGLSTGALAGIVVGSLVGLGMVGAAFFYVWKMKHGVTVKAPVTMQVEGGVSTTASSKTSDVQMEEKKQEQV